MGDWFSELFGLGNGGLTGYDGNPLGGNTLNTNGAGLPGSNLQQAASAGSGMSTAALSAGAQVLSGFISMYQGNKINKELFKIKQIEKEIGQIKAKGERESALWGLYEKADKMRSAAAAKAQSDQQKMDANQANIEVAMAAKGIEGGSASEVRQSLTNARRKQDLINLSEYNHAERAIAHQAAGIESRYTYASAAAALGPGAYIPQVPNIGGLGLDAMLAYYKYKGFVSDVGDLK